MKVLLPTFGYPSNPTSARSLSSSRTELLPRRTRSERIVSHLGAGPRHVADEGALAHVRISEQSDVRQELELESDRTPAPAYQIGTDSQPPWGGPETRG